ncbi:hypothetical protein [Streptacidiphilus albus]|uniref:hypothetical protein n=1 Tax=Streptacidiphilus albus TaxID=105425 RepID=UPI00054BD431|nr:hypothetical protein [Streptacidiphilus albus]
MTAQPDESVVGGGEIAPRPARTIADIRAALAVVAPDQFARLAEEHTKATDEAIKAGSIGPVRAFLEHWAAIVEIERFPETAETFHRARYLADHAASLDDCRKYVHAYGEIYRSACKAVSA